MIHVWGRCSWWIIWQGFGRKTVRGRCVRWQLNIIWTSLPCHLKIKYWRRTFNLNRHLNVHTYCFQGYFRPSALTNAVLLRFKFAQTRFCIIEIKWNIGICRVLNLPADTKGERGEKKTEGGGVYFPVYSTFIKLNDSTFDNFKVCGIMILIMKIKIHLNVL